MGEKQIVLLFGEGSRNIQALGGKGAGLAEMVRIGVSVPPGFTVTTTVARAQIEHGRFPVRYEWQFKRGITAIEKATGKKFGDSANPLLVSVRSGSRVSMPGMMDTVLNLGLNPDTVQGLAKNAGSEWFAWDCYRRFLAMFGDVVLGIERSRFENLLAAVKKTEGVKDDRELSLVSIYQVAQLFRLAIREETGRPVPDDPWEQLQMAVAAVFNSWENERAKEYRRVHKIPSWWGTAANVQAMVFGNHGDDSGTGVVFSRNVSTGEAGLYGEFLTNAQGEDVVAGVRTPLPIAKMRDWNPKLFVELEQTVRMLETHFNDVVDVEFTVEKNRLYILQVRVAKRTPEAAVITAVHLVWRKMWTRETAMEKVTPEQVEAVSRPVFDAEALKQAVETQLVGKGLPASPGAAVGRVVFTSEEAVSAAKSGEKVILIRPDTSPDDLSGMLAAVAIVTETGGATSHAAVVARSLGKPAVVGAKEIHVKEGQIISVDGATGVIVFGEVPVVGATQRKEIEIYLRWRAALAPKWPQPLIHQKYIGERVSVNQLLNDFYLVDAMALAAKGTALESEAVKLRYQIHLDTALRLIAYLAVAVAGELRHFQLYASTDKPKLMTCCEEHKAESLEAIARWEKNSGRPDNSAKDYETLRRVYKVGGDSGDSQLDPFNTLIAMTTEEQAEFFRLAVEAFNGIGRWQGGYGGPKWASIANAGLQFLSGKLNHSAFADHAFDLQHNNGSVFGKHRMLEGDRTTVRTQLEEKKYASGVTNLYERLNKLSTKWDKAVIELFEKGKSLGIWVAGGSKTA